jgi:peptidoglycan/xylan/chitin deacetylase (PgdA/CDA1 family)
MSSEISPSSEISRSSDISRRRVLTAGLGTVAGVALAACGGKSSPAARAGGTPTATPLPTASPTPPPNPRAVKANELGFVPILMHHRLTNHVNSEFDMTPAYFRAELERLHREGYYPVTTLDVVRRTLDHVPAGKTPVALTFDDGSSGQFGLRPDGSADPNTAVGIMLAFTKAHPDFPATASFYINSSPFAAADTAKTLTALHRLGFEIGNHTYDHANLSSLSDVGVAREFAELQQLVESAVPGLVPHTMALPFGVEPKHRRLAHRGTYKGTTYVNEAVLLVGANPSHSPYHKDFDPLALPRIRSSSYHGGRGLYIAKYWLDYLAKNDDQRYRSAGNPGRVTFPKSYAGSLAPRFRAHAVTY